MKSATAWALGQLGRHTPDHAKAVADTGVLPLLVTLENDAHSTEDLKGKCRKALKAVVAKLTFMPALDALVHRSGTPLLMLDHAPQHLPTPPHTPLPPDSLYLLQPNPLLASDPPSASTCSHWHLLS